MEKNIVHMRESRVLRKLRQGKVVSCVKINLSCPSVTEIAAMTGFDCLWTDMEHVPNDWRTLEHQIRSAKIHNVDMLVRVQRGSYSDHIKPFEIDASGIMVPHVMNLEDAKDVARWTRFHPIGRRPLDGGNADAAFCMVSTEDYIHEANDQRFVILQIEDPEPLKQLDEIAKLDGIDMLFFGPADFSQGIGAPGQMDHPLIDKTRRQIADICRANGKFAGTVGSPDNLQELIDMGYHFISMGADVIGLQQYFEKIGNAFAKLK